MQWTAKSWKIHQNNILDAQGNVFQCGRPGTIVEVVVSAVSLSRRKGLDILPHTLHLILVSMILACADQLAGFLWWRRRLHLLAFSKSPSPQNLRLTPLSQTSSTTLNNLTRIEAVLESANMQCPSVYFRNLAAPLHPPFQAAASIPYIRSSFSASSLSTDYLT